MSAETRNTGAATEFSKVAAVTFTFWIIKILCTTLGEAGGDAVTMGDAALKFSGVGYVWGTAIFAVLFLVLVAAQILAKKFHPLLYWATIIATTTVGTTLADLADRDGGLGYLWGSALLMALLLASLGVWYKVAGTISVGSVSTPRAEFFYWLTIMFSQTLGTALGDWASDSMNLGYLGSVYVFGGALVLVAVLYFVTKISRTGLFWAAFILTRPLGAVSGDLFDKPVAKGGFAMSRFELSGVLLALIAICVLVFPHRAAAREEAH
ncbi:COG4705 family protein [Terracidiphilus gabretensis]|jgi:uncharacterized membrane-anchored protein|uniref:COG4705 family protein n=1 Tax=Terracidiphilus gabretensis TaxID=1577687 RepID=UPI00071B4715|nr:hypothetical protein [Terracidiphilus gabretensis]